MRIAETTQDFVSCVVFFVWHPSGATLYRSDNAMDVASGADKRYLVHCAHEKTVCLELGICPIRQEPTLVQT